MTIRTLMAFGYAILCVVVLVVPAKPQVLHYLWVLGPTASLVYGASYIWMFGVGTLLFGGCVDFALRSQSSARRAIGVVLCAECVNEFETLA